MPPGGEKGFLHPLPVERLWGVGKKTARRLHSLGLKTIGDVATAPTALLDRHLGHAHALHLKRLADGEDDRPVEPGRERKQIGRETTFDADVDDRERVRRTLLSLTEEVAARLRRRGQAAHTVTVKLRLAPFLTRTRRTTVEGSLFTTEAIYPLAKTLLAAADPGDRAVRLIGISVSGLHELPPERQLTLFAESGDEAGRARVSKALDEVTQRFGRGSLRRAKLIDDSQNEEEDEEE